MNLKILIHTQSSNPEEVEKMSMSRLYLLTHSVLIHKHVFRVLLLVIPFCFLSPLSGQTPSRSAYRKQAITYLRKKEPDSAKHFFQLALSVSTNLSQKADLGLIFGQIKGLDNNRQALITYYDSLNNAFHDLELNSFLPYSYRDLAIIYSDIGLSDKALEYFQESYNGFIAFNDPKNANGVLNSIAITLKEDGDKSLSEKYLREIIVSNESLADSASTSLLYNNLGNLYLDLEQPDSALSFFKSSLQFQTTGKDTARTSISLLGIGEAYRKKQSYDSSEYYLLGSLKAKATIPIHKGLSILHHNLARLYLARNKIDEVQLHLEKGKEVANQLGLLQDLTTNALLWSEYYEKTGNTKKALSAHKNYVSLKDSLSNKERSKSLLEMQTRFETQRLQENLDDAKETNDLQKSLLQQQQYTIASLSVGAIALLITAVLLYRLYRLKQKQKKATEWRMREQHHRVGNNIAVLSTLLNQAGNDANSDEAKALALEGKSRLEAMNLLHSKLYWKDETATIPLKPYIAQLTNQILSLYIPYHPNAVALELEEIALPVTRAIPLSLIINEIITNSCKYGLSKATTPKLEIKLFSQNGKLEIYIKNNGITTMPTLRYQNSPSFGHTLIDTLSRQLKGSFSIDIQKHYAIGKFKMPLSS